MQVAPVLKQTHVYRRIELYIIAVRDRRYRHQSFRSLNLMNGRGGIARIIVTGPNTDSFRLEIVFEALCVLGRPGGSVHVQTNEAGALSFMGHSQRKTHIDAVQFHYSLAES